MEWWKWALLALALWVTWDVLALLHGMRASLSRIVAYLDAADEVFGLSERLTKVRELNREIALSDYALRGREPTTPTEIPEVPEATSPASRTPPG